MRKTIILSLLITSCGKPIQGPAGVAGTDCTVSKSDVVTTITCSDGSTTHISDGVEGKPGVAGVNGSNGHSIAFKQVVADNSICSNGGYVLSIGLDTDDNGVLEDKETTSVAIICNGTKGDTGAAGAQGVAGSNATPVVAVQFCPGYTAHYPSVFPEYGFLLNNKIYAVYWDNHNAWMTIVPPGYYESTSTTAPCNFQVSANGSITN